jgi:WD40 repeat protein
MSENEFLNALKEEMPDDFGRDLLAQLKAEEKKKVKPLPSAVWTVAAACFATILVGFLLFISRMPNTNPMSVARETWQMRDPITPENIHLAEPLLTIGYGHAEAIALSPDNNTLAVATSIGIYLHDAHNLEAAPRFLGVPEGIEVDVPFMFRFFYMEYSEDGRLFIFISSRREMALFQWDESSQSFLKPFSLAQSGTMHPQVVDLSPDGTKLLLGACSNSNQGFGNFCPANSLVYIKVTELATGESLFFRSSHEADNAIVAMSPDWTTLAFQEDNQIKLVDLESQEMQTILVMEAAEPVAWDNYGTAIPWYEMHSLYFSPDGTKLGVKDDIPATMNWWDIAELEVREEILTVPAFGNDSTVYFRRKAVAVISPLGEQYIIATDIGILGYDYFETHPSMRIESATEPISLLMSSDAETLYTLDDTGLIRVWDLVSEVLGVTSTRYGLGVDLDFTISPDSSTFIRGSYSYYDGLGYVFELTNSGIEQVPLSSGENGYMATPKTAISPDGRYVAFMEDEALWVYDRQEQRSIQLDGYSFWPELAFRSDGALIAIALYDSDITANLYTAEMLETGDIPANTAIGLGEVFPISSLRFTPDGTKVIVYYCQNISSTIQASCRTSSVHVFDTYTWDEISLLTTGLTEEGYFNGISVSYDSNWLLFAYCGETEVVNDGWRCARDKNVVEIYNLQELDASTEPLMRLEVLPYTFWTSVFSLRPYADGSFIVTTLSYDVEESIGEIMPTTTFWHVKADGEYEELLRIQRSGITMSPDGSYFLTARNGQVELWGVPAGITRAD